ncbi:hypothetical protein F8M41_022387 [Gigaspora margarita]|uniref:Uncharacterized protein n=1 Tax=Gigaspora margarita TaxID=4874 RepID=A0A8H4AF38_GIGMA|nr:hypothetical protein F8M41_022387 [Gigaspora margarita]
MLRNKFGTKNDKNNKFFSLRQRFSYNTSKSLTQDSLESSTIQLDPSTVYSSDEPMEYYEESNKTLATNAYNELVEILHHPQFNLDHVSNKIKKCYYLSIKNIIWNVLNNPSLMWHMYFGPGQEVTYKSEYWYSNLWSESPLYGQESITINNIQKIIKFGELPKNIQSSNRQVSSQSEEVWLVDQVINNLVNKHEVIGHAISLPQSENIPVLKLFLDLYYDDFGTYRNVYHSLGGVYIQFGNMPISLRQQLRNHFVLGFVPFGGSFDEFIRPFIMEIKFLESGQLMNIQGQKYWVIASLGVVTADLPQGNDLAGVKRHSANKGCRTCQVSKEHFTNNNLDFKNLSRYQHITNSQFHEIASSKSIQEHKLVATKYGLCNKSQKEFIEVWKNFEYPPHWGHLPNPISHHESFMMSDYLHLAMVIPFILN